MWICENREILNMYWPSMSDCTSISPQCRYSVIHRSFLSHWTWLGVIKQPHNPAHWWCSCLSSRCLCWSPLSDPLPRPTASSENVNLDCPRTRWLDRLHNDSACPFVEEWRNMVHHDHGAEVILWLASFTELTTTTTMMMTEECGRQHRTCSNDKLP